MSKNLLFERMSTRVALDKDDGNHAYFHALTLQLEYLSKVVTAAVVACVGDDVDRNRYSLEHHLVRADSIGLWVRSLHNALLGQPAQLFRADTQHLIRDLTQKVRHTDWRHSAVTALHRAAAEVGVSNHDLGRTVALHQFFALGAELRNRSRGHGAPTTAQCGSACPYLADACNTVIENLTLFRLPWAYLHRNLSGKYRVSPLLADVSPFDHLKRQRDIDLPNGVYFYLDRPTRIPLIFSDPDVADISLPNGNFKTARFETLSYVTNEVVVRDGTPWLAPPGRLPASETEGRVELEPVGNVFTNFPPCRLGTSDAKTLKNK